MSQNCNHGRLIWYVLKFNSDTLILGSSRFNGKFFTGIIDDVRVYNRALSESKILELYHEGENNSPKITSFTADPTSGIHPLDVAFECTTVDPDGSVVEYRWNFGDGSKDTTTTDQTKHTYTDVGTYYAKVTVVDNDGAERTSTPISIKVAYGPELTGKCERYSITL
ncbi:MAG: PKD domain-containing protein [Candidatus Brocadiaceae bacterium]